MTSSISVQGNTNQLPKTEKQNNKLRNTAIGCAGVAAGWEADYFIRKGLKIPTGKWTIKEIKKIHGVDYRKYLETAIKQNKLEKDLKIIDLNPQTAEQVKKSLKISFKEPKGIKKFLAHIFRLPTINNNKSFEATKKGFNAFFSPRDNAVVCNLEKFSAPLFHEICHKLNKISKNPLISTLAKIRCPLAVFVPTIISGIAIFTDPKEKNGEDKKGFKGFVKKHCGLLAAGAMLPLTMEECIANIRGTDIARKAGVTGEALKKIKNLHKASVISYCTGIIATGLSVHLGSKIRDYICSKKETQA